MPKPGELLSSMGFGRSDVAPNNDEEQNKNAAAAEQEDAGGGGEENANNDREAQVVEAPPLGKCQLLVHAIEARDLASRDADGTCDPLVKVRSAAPPHPQAPKPPDACRHQQRASL